MIEQLIKLIEIFSLYENVRIRFHTYLSKPHNLILLFFSKKKIKSKDQRKGLIAFMYINLSSRLITRHLTKKKNETAQLTVTSARSNSSERVFGLIVRFVRYGKYHTNHDGCCIFSVYVFIMHRAAAAAAAQLAFCDFGR